MSDPFLDETESNVLDTVNVTNEPDTDDWFSFDGDWSDTWGDFDPEWETFSTPQSSSQEDSIYSLDGYGTIYELDDYLSSGTGMVELLDHATSREQFNYILGMSRDSAYDDVLLGYLIENNYSIEDYLSINVGFQIRTFSKLVEYLLSKANDAETKKILLQVAYVDEKIADILISREDRNDIIHSNFYLDKEYIIKRIIQYYKENPSKVDFSIIDFCYLNEEIVREFMSLGYEITKDCPYRILEMNDIMREEFLKTITIEDSHTFQKLEEEIRLIPGSYGMLYQSDAKEIFHKEFTDVFGSSAVEQMIKYIVLGDYKIDLSKINGDTILLIKGIYDLLCGSNTFDIQLFTKIIYKYNRNPSVFNQFHQLNLDPEQLRLYFEYEELAVNNVEELNHVDEVFYRYQDDKIKSSNHSIDLKNTICVLLTNQTYFETKKGLLELASSEKLAVLKNSIHNEDISKQLDSFIILSRFLEKVDSIDDVEQLREIANLLNQQVLKNGVRSNWLHFNQKLLDFYTYEANERMTDFGEYLTDTFYDATDFTFGDGVSVHGRRVEVAHVKSGEEFNSFIHVMNAYQNGGTTGSIESIQSPKFIGQSYICLTGISDEYSRICMNQESRFSIKVLYSHIPNGSMFCAANRDTGINAKSNSKDITTRLPANIASFRRLVRNTETHGSETYNEYDIFRDGLVPSGIAYMFDEPTEEEINAAAYLGVPLVKIDDLQESYQRDSHFLHRGALPDDESFYHIREHDYENREITITPNDKFDAMIQVMDEEIHVSTKKGEVIDAYCVPNEMSRDEYFVTYQGEEYSAAPVYDFVDSRRVNVDAEEYERSFIKHKLYQYLDIQPRTQFISCKYPNGQELLSVIHSTENPKFLDRYIDYLADVPYSRACFDDLNSTEIESKEELDLLYKIYSLDDDSFLALFESLIKSNHYYEPNIMINNILQRKNQISSIVSAYQNHALVDTANLEVFEMLEDEPVSESGYSEQKK